MILLGGDIVATTAEARAAGREPLLVLGPLQARLQELGLGDEPIENLRRIGEGHSNVTFGFNLGDRRLVLRRPPRGPVPRGTHNVLREAQIQGALAGRAPVPEIIAAVDDPTVIGVPFYLMGHVDGVAIASELPAELDSPAARRQLGLTLVDTLVELHAVELEAVGLAGYGRPDGYLSRQVERFAELWASYRTESPPEVVACSAQIDGIVAWLRGHLPGSGDATIVHGDYRLGNVLIDERAPVRLNAILDWEMSTLGDPLADLAYLLMVWSERGDPAVAALDLQPITREPGFAARAELAARYSEGSGRDVTGLGFFTALATFKALVIFAGNLRRARSGSSGDVAMLELAAGFDRIVERSLLAIEASERDGF